MSTAERKRLFVALSTEPFSWFKSGRKSWELRKYGRTFTEKQIAVGRSVELRRGYSTEDSIWGSIVEVVRAESLSDFFDEVQFQSVIPSAPNRHEAIVRCVEILRLNSDADGPVLGFRVETSDDGDTASP